MRILLSAFVTFMSGIKFVCLSQIFTTDIYHTDLKETARNGINVICQIVLYTMPLLEWTYGHITFKHRFDTITKDNPLPVQIFVCTLQTSMHVYRFIIIARQFNLFGK